MFLTQKRWDEIKNVQRKTAAAQMLQNPLLDTEQVFRPEFCRPLLCAADDPERLHPGRSLEGRRRALRTAPASR